MINRVLRATKNFFCAAFKAISPVPIVVEEAVSVEVTSPITSLKRNWFDAELPQSGYDESDEEDLVMPAKLGKIMDNNDLKEDDLINQFNSTSSEVDLFAQSSSDLFDDFGRSSSEIDLFHCSSDLFDGINDEDSYFGAQQTTETSWLEVDILAGCSSELRSDTSDEDDVAQEAPEEQGYRPTHPSGASRRRFAVYRLHIPQMKSHLLGKRSCGDMESEDEVSLSVVKRFKACAEESASPKGNDFKFSFKFGVSSAPKTSFLYWNMINSCMVKDGTKYNECGEDSYAIAINDRQQVLCVADGVGGSVNPAIFTQTLMSHVQDEFEMSTAKDEVLKVERNSAGPKSVYNTFQDAYHKMCAAHPHRPGSCTVSMISIEKSTGIMEGANLGDSGYIIVRDGRIVNRSTPIQHSFNCPYQVSTFVDESDYMELQSLQLQEGDLVVLATDGLWDNLYDHDILKVVCSEKDTTEAAKNLVHDTFKKINKKHYVSPFKKYCERHGVPYGSEGKVDDTTVIVAVVEKRTI